MRPRLSWEELAAEVTGVVLEDPGRFEHFFARLYFVRIFIKNAVLSKEAGTVASKSFEVFSTCLAYSLKYTYKICIQIENQNFRK